MTGERTPYAMLVELQSLLLEDLIHRLKEPNPPAEVLAIARTLFLASGLALELNDKQRSKLARLQRLHLERLLEALTSTEKVPSASIFAEVRQVLASAPMRDLAVDMKACQAAVELVKAALPFPVQ